MYIKYDDKSFQSGPIKLICSASPYFVGCPSDQHKQFYWMLRRRAIHVGARDLGVFFDTDLSLQRHVDVAVSRSCGCYAARQLRSIRQYVTISGLQSLMTSLVLNPLD